MSASKEKFFAALGPFMLRFQDFAPCWFKPRYDPVGCGEWTVLVRGLSGQVEFRPDVVCSTDAEFQSMRIAIALNVTAAIPVSG